MEDNLLLDDIKTKLGTVLEEVQQLKNELYWTRSELNEVRTKLSMHNDIMQIKNSLFWLPNYPQDWIQRHMVNSCDYWEIDCLHVIDKYLKDEAVIVDIGANIGAYSVYWANERRAKKIYAFEPMQTTFNILSTNIGLNNLSKPIFPYNMGLSNVETKASVGYFNSNNIGSTTVVADVNGQMKLTLLDKMKIKEKIDLIKIDVEGAEVEVLEGALETLKKYKPVISIESFNRKEEVEAILFDLGYKLVEVVKEGEEYIYS